MNRSRNTSGRAVTLLTFALLLVTAIVIANPWSSFRGADSRVPDVPGSQVQAPEYVPQWARGLDMAMLAHGSPGAPVTILVFHDYQCQFCRMFSNTLDSVLAVHPGTARVMLIDYPLDYHPFAVPAAHAATCAHERGVLSAWVEAAYRDQDSLGAKPWGVIATEIGIADSAGFERCVGSEPASRRIQQALEFGTAIGVEGTPTVVVDGWRYRDPPSPPVLLSLMSSTHGREATPLPGGGRMSHHFDSLPLGRRLGIYEELRVGGTSDSGSPLNTVGQVLVGRETSLMVTQPALPGVLVFDSAGRLSGILGGRGDGPGEFQDLHSVGILGDDTLYMTDRATGKVAYFHGSQFLRSRRWVSDIEPLPFADGGLLLPNVPQVVVSENRALVRPNLMVLPTSVTTDQPIDLPIWLMDEESRVVDTLLWEELGAVGTTIVHGGTEFQAVVPLQRESFTRLGAGGTGVVEVSHDAGRSSLTAIAPSGDTLFVRRLEHTPLPMTDEAIRRAILDTPVLPAMPDGEEAEIRSALARTLRRQGHIPEYLSPITDLFVGQDGSIWLRREETGGGMIEYSVFWGDGTPRGTVGMPASQRVVAAHHEVVAAIEEDELGVPTVVRYRVQR